MSSLTPFQAPSNGQLNLLINPSFLIDQIKEGTGYAMGGGTALTQLQDCWSFDVVNVPQAFSTVTSAHGVSFNIAAPPVLAANSRVTLYQTIEKNWCYPLNDFQGYPLNLFVNIEDISAVGTNKTVGVTLKNLIGGGINSIYVTDFTYAAPFKGTIQLIIPFPPDLAFGSPLTPQFYDINTPNVAGMQLEFHLVPSPNNAVAAGNLNKWLNPGAGSVSPNIKNVYVAANDSFLPNRVVLSYGPFQPFYANVNGQNVLINYSDSFIQTESYSEELIKCQRYYQKSFTVGVPVQQAVGNVVDSLFYFAVNNFPNTLYGVNIFFNPVMRAVPILTTYNPIHFNALWYNNKTGADSGVASSVVGSRNTFLYNPGVAADVATDAFAIHYSANARLS